MESKKNRQIRATLLWYKEQDAIAEQDIEKFKEMTDMRNMLGHDLFNRVIEGLPENIYENYIEMIELFEKITKWWIKEIEIPTSSEIKPEQYDAINWDEVTSVNLEFIKIMTDIVFTGNEEYSEYFKQAKQ